MAKFLIRSFDDPKGFVELDAPTGNVPRSREESYVPWGLTGDSRVVYAKTGEHTGWRGGSGPTQLRQYDSVVSQQRQRLCQSELGGMALDQPAYTAPAVGKVSKAVAIYLKDALARNRDGAMECVYKDIGHYFFTGGPKGFGRISLIKKTALQPKLVWEQILYVLENGRLDQVLAIHDAVGRKVLEKLGGSPFQKYQELGPIVRQDWFDDRQKRGRANASSPATATTRGGIAGGGFGGVVAQSRVRGVDSFRRDLGRTRHKDADLYYDDLDSRNLVFGAGISGTTGTLLQAGIAFGRLSGDEELKQYVLAIVGYLIGGGMHSYHETMAVAAKVGVPYNPGAFETSMPAIFTGTAAYRDWRTHWYDVVVLGALHWRHNAGALPSHLNKQLKPAS